MFFMELLAEIQMDIKANKRQCEKIEQVLASHHTRAIEETKAAAHDAKAAIEVVRQMQAVTLSHYSFPSSLHTPRSPYTSPSSSLTPRSPSCVLRQMPPLKGGRHRELCYGMKRGIRLRIIKSSAPPALCPLLQTPTACLQQPAS